MATLNLLSDPPFAWCVGPNNKGSTETLSTEHFAHQSSNDPKKHRNIEPQVSKGQTPCAADQDCPGPARPRLQNIQRSGNFKKDTESRQPRFQRSASNGRLSAHPLAVSWTVLKMSGGEFLLKGSSSSLNSWEPVSKGRKLFVQQNARQVPPSTSRKGSVQHKNRRLIRDLDPTTRSGRGDSQRSTGQMSRIMQYNQSHNMNKLHG